VDEFLNPKAAITPFISGCVVTTIANTLWYAFGFLPVIVAFILSVLYAVVIVKDCKDFFIYKCIYFVFNTLIVFSLAYSNTLAGNHITTTRQLTNYYNPYGSAMPTQQREFFVDWFNL
jgi:hypothetical protein